MLKWNSIKIKGDNNIVLQDVDGNSLTLTFEVFLKQFTESKDKIIDNLEQLLRTKEKLSVLEMEKAGKELDAAITERDRLREIVKKLLTDFEGKNLTDTSEYYKKAHNLFINGQIDLAIATLNERDVVNDLADIELEEKAALEKLARVNAARKKLAEELALKARLLSINADIAGAKQTYEKALSILRNYDTVGGYAFYLHYLHEYDVAHQLFVEVLTMQMEPVQRSIVLNELGVIETEQNNFKQALLYLQEALGIDKALSNVENLGRTTMHLGNLYMRRGQTNDAISAYLDSEANYQRLNGSYPRNPDYMIFLAKVKSNIGAAYFTGNNFKAADKYYMESLRLYREALLLRPNQLLPEFAEALSNVAKLYDVNEQFTEAVNYLTTAVDYFRKLAGWNPRPYEFELARALNNLGAVYEHLNKFPEAVKSYKEALDISLQKEQISPAIYKPNVAIFYSNLALVYERAGQYGVSEEHYLQSISRKRELAAVEPAAYETGLALTIDNLGVLYGRMEQFERAIDLHYEALDIYKRYAELEPTTYLPDIARVYRNIGVVFDAVQNYQRAIEFHLASLDTYMRLNIDIPRAFEGEIGNVQLSLAASYLNSGNNEEGSKMLAATYGLFSGLFQESPEKYYVSFVLVLTNMAKYLLIQGQDRWGDARKLCSQAKDILTHFAYLDNPAASEQLAVIDWLQTELNTN